MTPAGIFFRISAMLSSLYILVKTCWRAIVRDRMLYAVLGVAVAMLLLVPALSSFSMRQVQELSISLSLSTISAFLLVVTLLLGASSVWRDIERRYSATVLTLPVGRGVYLLSKYVSILLFLGLCVVTLGLGAALVIYFSASSYPSDIAIHWGNIVLSLVGCLLKYQLLASFALLLSAVSTSFYLPFFGTLAIYLCGSASQEVYEYVTSASAGNLQPLTVKAVSAAYYLLPNLSAFDFQTQAVYGLEVSWQGAVIVFGYALVYSAILLILAMLAFRRRELA